ncbi:hypothetical protein TRFO_09303 [Tritrichomonas foetus]|uniref:Uncharacterized protein n=1 Tax=Tritrichomonas foetus TaxID=1144522 RepID=A0A1J4JEM9_9EUKA|nr:hypothetical protein TRFO_09303 [Tritrichomonas foetus]|eukprot:OHS97610.1 hypothetical protein TRFO_09303 [Tritrichomonas foetus]
MLLTYKHPHLSLDVEHKLNKRLSGRLLGCCCCAHSDGLQCHGDGRRRLMEECAGRSASQLRLCVKELDSGRVLNALSSLCDLIHEDEFPCSLSALISEEFPQNMFSLLKSDDKSLSTAAFSTMIKFIEIPQICPLFITPEYCQYLINAINEQIFAGHNFSMKNENNYDSWRNGNEQPEFDDTVSRDLIYVIKKFLESGFDMDISENLILGLDIANDETYSPSLVLGPNLEAETESENVNSDIDNSSDASNEEDASNSDICYFFLHNNIIEILSHVIKHTHDSSLVDLCFDTLEALCCHFLRVDDASKIFKIISACRPIPRAALLNKILRIFLRMFAAQTLADPIVFSKFEDSGFLELTQGALGGRTDDASTLHACLVAARVYENFPECEYQFHIRRLLELTCNDDFESPGSEKVATAAAQALASQLQANPPLALNILKTPKTYQSLLTAAVKRSILAKIALTDIFAFIAKYTNLKAFPALLSEFDVGDIKMNIFAFAADISPVSPQATKKALKLLLAIFDRAAGLGKQKLCQVKFMRAFEENFFIDSEVFADDETASEFSLLKEHLSCGVL